MGEGKLTALTTPTPLNRQSPNTAHVITSTISPHTPHLVKVAPGVTSPHIAKVTTQFFYFFVRNIFQPRAQAAEPILSRDTSTDAYSRLLGVRRQYFHIFTLNPPPKKKTFLVTFYNGKRMENIRITAWCIEILCWNFARGLTLPSTLSTRKSFSVRGRQGDSSPTLNFGTPHFLGN